MRARVRLLGGGFSIRMLGRRRVCSVVLLPAVAAMAVVIGGADTAAASTDWRWEGRRQASHVARDHRRWETPRRQRSRVSRAGARRADHRQHHAPGGRRLRAVGPTRAQVGSRTSRPDAATATTELLPLQQRSLVASHPLLPATPVASVPGPLDFLTGPSGPVAGTTSPRCREAHPNVFALAIASIASGLGFSQPAMVEGAWPHCRSASHPQTTWHKASLGPSTPGGVGTSVPPAGSGAVEPIHWRASAECLASPLRAVLDQLAGEFGPLTVNSTCRSPSHNRRVGGAVRSRHLTGDAVDFRVRGNYSEVHIFLKKLRSVGGLAHYGSGVFHIDTGPRRTWAPGSWRRA